MSPIILVGTGILLFALGIGLGYLIAFGQRKQEATRASNIQNELDDYRRQVTEHFGETAHHFQAIGQQYQSLYRHMAQGADALCDAAQSDALLGFAAGSAPAIVAGSADEPEEEAEIIEAPEIIRDYAAEDDNESPQEETEVEMADESELLEESSVDDDSSVEPPEDEAIGEQITASEPVETERTVH